MVRGIPLARRMSACLVAAGCAVALAATPASAATWTVTGGLSINGHGRTDFIDTTSGMTLAICRDSSFTGGFVNGTALPGAGLGKMTAWSFHDTGVPAGQCTASPAGGLTTATATALPYSFNAVSYNATTKTTTGTLTGIRINLYMTDGCHAQVAGPGGTTGTLNWSLRGTSLTFSGGNLVLTTTNTLCDPGTINPEDTVSAPGTYTVLGPPTITSP
ncbi:hypothetical protein AB0J52_22860 [Spirillospora sp. NPDC049652]